MEQRIRKLKQIKEEKQTILTTALNTASLTLRKKKIENFLNQKREIEIIPKIDDNRDLNLIKIKESFYSLLIPQPANIFIQIFNNLNFLFRDDIALTYEDFINFQYVTSIHNVISNHSTNANILIPLILFLSKSSKIYCNQIQELFLKSNPNGVSHLVNYYHLLKFALSPNQQASYRHLLDFFCNLIEDCPINQNIFLDNYRVNSNNIIKTIYNAVDIQKETNLDLVYSQIKFFASFSRIDFKEHSQIFPLLFPMMTHIIFKSNFYYEQKKEILYSALWGTSYLALTLKSEHLYMFFDNSLIELLFSIGDINNKFFTPVIKIFGNLLSNTMHFVMILLEKNMIDYLIKHLFSCDLHNKEKIWWAFSNIAAEACAIEKLFDKKVFQISIDMLKSNPSYNLIKEIWWYLQNAFDFLTPIQSLCLYNMKIIELIVEFLEKWNDPLLLTIVIDGLIALLLRGVVYKNKPENIFLEVLKQHSGKELLQKIYLNQKNVHLQSLCLHILKKYLDEDIAMN